MNKRDIISKKNLPVFRKLVVLSLFSPLVGWGQDTVVMKRDSIGQALHIDILNKQFLIAGDLYKIRKYKLQQQPGINPDSLFQKSVEEYKRIYQLLPAQRQQYYFSDNFYAEVIPVLQYFRSAPAVNLFMGDRQKLHPQPVVPDPKHHESTIDDHHHQEQ